MLIKILIYIVIFCIMNATINWGVSYWKNVIIYGVISAIGNLIYFQIISFSVFFMSFAIYLVIGFFVVWILEKIADALNIWFFVFLGIVVQYVISIIFSVLLSF